MNDELESFADSVDESTVEMTEGNPEGAEAVETAPETETVENEESAPTAEQPDEQTMVPLAAKQAEKERRQRAEREVEQLRAQVSGQQNQNKPDFWDNPEQTLARALYEQKIQMSEDFVKINHSDYDDVMDHYEDMVKKNPSLYAEAAQTGMPAYHAYNTAKKDMEIQKIGDIEAYTKKVQQEAIAAYEASKKSNVPPNMTNVRSSGSDPEMTEFADTNDELFNLLDKR